MKRVNCAHTTDAEGRFEIGGVPSGRRWALQAQKDGYSGERISLGDDDATSPITLRLVREPEHFTIAGRVVDQQGRPLPGITLVVAEPVRGDGRPGDRTDVDGRFSIRTPFPGEQPLQGLGLLFPPGRFEDPDQTFAVRAGDEGLELVLNRIAGSCAVTIEVVDALNGTPLEMTSAWLFPADPGSPLRAERPVVSPGRVEVEAVPAGRWRLSCQVDGRGEVEHAFDVPDAASSLHERVEVPRLGTVRVRFEWQGANTDPVTLTFDRRVFVDDDRNVPYVRVAPNGSLLVRTQPGPLHLSIDGRFAYGEDSAVDVASGEEREVVIRGGPGGQLTTAGLAAMTPASAALFLRTEDEQDWRCISVHRRGSNSGDGGYELTKGVAPGRGQWRVHRTEEDPAQAASDDDPTTWPIVAAGAFSIAVGETVRLQVSTSDGAGR